MGTRRPACSVAVAESGNGQTVPNAPHLGATRVRDGPWTVHPHSQRKEAPRMSENRPIGFREDPRVDSPMRRTERDELRGALSNTICNASFYPKRAQPYLLGGDMSEVLDRTADALLAAGYRKDAL
jgi:hypothetical protein